MFNEQKQKDKPHKLDDKHYIDLLSNIDDIESAMIRQNETIKSRARHFIEIANNVQVADWKLVKLTSKFDNGVSIYAYFRKELENRRYIIQKIRLSDHRGHWSGHNLDLRNPKDSTSIEKYLATN